LKFVSAWRQGIMSLAEAMSLDKPENGWFIPNCEDGTLFFSSQSIEQRKNVEIPLFVTGDKQNVLQVILFAYGT
jgi:hypothetical protein